MDWFLKSIKGDIKVVEKPWGQELIWAITSKYVGKILEIKEGHQLSLQHHEVKDETIMILDGQMILQIGKDSDVIFHTMSSGDIYHIEPGVIHRMTALKDTKVIEVSTPELEDVVRHSDNYGR